MKFLISVGSGGCGDVVLLLILVVLGSCFSGVFWCLGLGRIGYNLMF